MKKNMVKILNCLLFLFSLNSILLAEQKVIYSNGELTGNFDKLIGQNEGKSITINRKNEQNNLSIDFSGSESWAVAFLNLKNDSIDATKFKYMKIKIRADKAVLLEEVGCGLEFPKTERIKKMIFDENWKTIIMALPKNITTLKTPFVVVSKFKMTLEIANISYLTDLPAQTDNELLLIPSKEERIEGAKYVYSENIEFGAPSGYSGEKNGISILLDDHCMESPYRGKYCMKFQVDDSEQWRALFFQAKGRWTPELPKNEELESLKEYKKLVFYARTDEKRYTISEVGFGGASPRFRQEPRNLVFVDLKKEWTRYELDIRGLDRTQINDVFKLVLKEGTFYLDEIRFEK